MSMIESLETRTFLAADLAVDITASRLPSDLINGAAVQSSVSAKVRNFGDPISRSALPVLLTASLRNDAGELTTIGSASVRVAGLSPGDSARNVTLRVTVPASLASGDYTLVITADPNQTQPDNDRTNNTATGNIVRVTDLRNDLIVTGTTNLDGTVEPGASGFVFVTLRNDGNKPLKSEVTVQVLLTSNGTTRTATTVSGIRINLGANRETRIRLINYSIPLSAPLGPTGVDIRVTPQFALPGDTLANNTAPLADLTLATLAAPTGALARLGLSDTLTFVRTDRDTDFGIYREEGTFKDSQGRTGKYRMYRPNPGDDKYAILQLTLRGREILDTELDFFNRDATLGSQKLTFGVSRSVSDGYIDLFRRDVFFALE